MRPAGTSMTISSNSTRREIIPNGYDECGCGVVLMGRPGKRGQSRAGQFLTDSNMGTKTYAQDPHLNPNRRDRSAILITQSNGVFIATLASAYARPSRPD